MGAKKQTIGYKYYLSLLTGLCRGPIDELVSIKCGDEIAVDNAQITGNALSSINKPDLFGGEKKEGGIQGPYAVYMGRDDQVIPGAQGSLPSLKGSIGDGLVSDMRGVVTLWFDGLVSAMNPYLKEWKFRVRRAQKGWWKDQAWYPEKAIIYMGDGAIKAMNGAHIIYECCTNPLWGRGAPAARLDENSFIYAANKLCSESFGICLVWYRKEDIDVFIQKICDLIGAVLYTDRETGLITLKLVRDDYVVDNLPLFTPSTGLLDIQEDDTGSSDSSFNEVIGTGRDPITNQDFQVRAQNIAAFQSQQSASSLDQDYRGIPTKDLLSRVVLRDLRANATGLKKFSVVLDRRAWRITPGAPFRVSDPSRGLNNIVLRAGEIDDGNMINGQITIKTVQDVFGLPATSYVKPADNSWQAPSKVAVPPAEERLIEASFRDIYLHLGSGDAESAPVDAAYIGQLAVAPNTTSYQYDLATMADGDAGFETRATGSFTGVAKLAAAITALQTEITLTAMSSFSADNIGQALYIGDELVRLDAFNESTGEATIARGVGDTLPAAHPLNARVWTIDDDLISDDRAYTEGETVHAKVLTRTASDLLALEDATDQSLVLVARQGRPYPPANVKVDDVSIYEPSGEHPEPVLTWASRNRLMQADQLVPYIDDSVAAEAGSTYTIRIYKQDDTLLRTVEGIADTTWTYTEAMQTEDGSPSTVRIELETVRDGIASWQKHSIGVALVAGWGYGWGANWGAPA